MDLSSPLLVLSLVGNVDRKRTRPRPSPMMPRYHSQKAPCFADAETQETQKRLDPDPYQSEYVREIKTYREPQRKQAISIVKIVRLSQLSSKSFSLKPADSLTPNESCLNLFSNRILHDRLNPLLVPVQKAKKQGNRTQRSGKSSETEENRLFPGQKPSIRSRTNASVLQSLYHSFDTGHIRTKGKSGLKLGSPLPMWKHKEIGKIGNPRTDQRSRKGHLQSLSFDINNRAVEEDRTGQKISSVSRLSL